MVMNQTASFRLKFLRQEEHLMMPRLSTIPVGQALYDILFQYLLTPEKEAKLMEILQRIEAYLKDNRSNSVPFSIPVEELAFLGEGVEELKLLLWQPIRVYVFEVEDGDGKEGSLKEETKSMVETVLNELVSFCWRDNRCIVVYPLWTL